MSDPHIVDAAFTLLLATLVAALLFGVFRAALQTRGAITPKRAALAACLAVGAVLAVDIAASLSGWSSRWSDLPPRIPALALSTLLFAALILRSASARTLLAAVPAFWLIGVHVFRFPLELILFALARQGRLPVQMTFEGQNFDVLIGLSAPFVAWALSRGKCGWRTVVAWNVGGLILLVNITVIAVRSAPGPLFAYPSAIPNTLVASLPYTFLPGIIVPLAYVLHVLSLRSALAERRRALADHEAAAPRPSVAT